MNELEYNRLQEISWRRKLTAEEEGRLQTLLLTSSEAQLEWEEDAALTHALDQLPNVPISSNFTAQVLQTLDLELAAEERQGRKSRDWRWWVHQFLPKAALGLLTVSLGLLGFTQYQRNMQRGMAENSFSVIKVAEVLPATVWQDFEAIRRLNVSTPAASEEELLAALR